MAPGSSWAPKCCVLLQSAVKEGAVLGEQLGGVGGEPGEKREGGRGQSFMGCPQGVLEQMHRMGGDGVKLHQGRIGLVIRKNLLRKSSEALHSCTAGWGSPSLEVFRAVEMWH